MVESEDFYVQEEKLPQYQVYQPRKINHPNFKNMSLHATKEFLQDKPVGEYLFRPSSKGTNFLNLTWKFYDNIL